MRRTIPFLTIVLTIFCHGIAFAGNGANFRIVEESSYLILSVACLMAAFLIFRILQGGSLGTPWLFFTIGFILAGAGALTQLFDLLKIFIYEYDLRPAMLVMRASSMLFILTGLVLYKKGLQ